MSKLDEMIRELCPDGVEYKRLEECCTLVKGKTPIQKAEPGEYPLVVTTSERRTCSTYQFDKPTVCIPLISSRGHGVASLNSVYYQEGKFALGNILCGVTPNDEDYLSAKFLFEYLNYKKDTLLVPLMKGGANVSMTVDSLKRVSVPVPPMQVQSEIVGILNGFTNLLMELTAELTARKTQYSFYRSRLLTFDANVEWKTVDEIAEVTDYVANGSFAALKENVNYKHTPDYAILVRTTDLVNGFDEENLVYIDKHAYNYLSKSKLYGGEIIINNIGAGVGTTFLCPCLDTYMSLAPNSIMVKTNNNKFYYYWLNSKEGQNAIRKIVSQGSLPKFNKTGFRSIRLPVPPLDVQNRIVNVLDNFEKICSDLNIGLPAEIEARQKQYEYYRDKLLTFKEVAAT